MAAFGKVLRLARPGISLVLKRGKSLHPHMREESMNHCSRLKEHYNYEAENRVLIIQKTMEHLQQSPVCRADTTRVQSISINDQFSSLGTDGASIFLYERIPQFKYHNPEIFVTCSKDISKPSDIVVNLVNGSSITLETDGKSSTEIEKEFCEAVQLEEPNDIT